MSQIGRQVILLPSGCCAPQRQEKNRGISELPTNMEMLINSLEKHIWTESLCQSCSPKLDILKRQVREQLRNDEQKGECTTEVTERQD